MKSNLKSISIFAIFCALALCGTTTAQASVPGDPCSLLSTAQLQKVLGQEFNPPTESKMPPAFGEQPWGSNCHYSSQASHVGVQLIVYVDASPADAKQTFDKLQMWFPAKSTPSGVGDSAYIDGQDAIHVLKGKVRYYISLHPANDNQLKELATAVAKQI